MASVKLPDSSGLIHKMMLARVFLISSLVVMRAFPSIAEEWAIHTSKPETSTVICVGNPVTPFCAVETYKACQYWLDKKKVCPSVGVDPDSFQFIAAGVSALSVYHYKLRHEKIINAEDILEVSKILETPVFTGDALVQLDVIHCTPVDACVVESRNDPNRILGEGCPPSDCQAVDNTITYLVRPFNDNWRFIDLYMYKQFQGEFWKRK